MTKKKSIFHRLTDVTRISHRAAFRDVHQQIEKHHHGSEDFLELVRDRYSCRSFNARPVSAVKIEKIIEAARLAPSAKNQQPVHIWVVRSAEAISRLKETSNSIYDAPVVFMVGCKPENAWVRKYDGKNGAETDAAIVGAHIMLEATDLDLGTVWVGSFDAKKIEELFPETAGWTITALFPVGHPGADAHPSENHLKRQSVEEFCSEI